jgi:MFS transporter, SP family, arabinose:H+ symporter
MATLLEMTITHVPVLAGELIELLDPQPGAVAVDCTVGGGGHARLIAERLGSSGTLIGIDRDPTAQERFEELSREVSCATRFIRASFADGLALLLDERIGGLGIGGSSVLGPMYIAEISPARSRGKLVGMFQFNIVFGILVAYLSNYLIGQAGLGDAEWRWKLGIAAVPAVFFFLMLIGIPQSPRWLVKQGRVDEAHKVLEDVGEGNHEEELAAIVESIDAEHGLGSEPLFQHKYRLPVFLAISIGMFNQLSGINAILYYLNDIFARAGFNKVSSDLQAVAIGATNFLATILAMSVIDKLGRKKMLLIGSVGTALCLGGVTAIFATGQHEALLVWLLVGFIAFFAFSQGAVIWVYLSEVFPTRVRAKGQSLGSFSHWFMNAVISMSFPLIAKQSGAAPFGLFTAMMVAQFFVVLFVFPETKCVTLEQMQKKLGIH